MPDERPRKPELSQREANRTFSNVLRAAGSMSDPDDPRATDPTAVAGDFAETAGEFAEGAGEFVEKGVLGAYDVIDAYMQQGQRVARSLGMPSYETVSTDQLSELSSRWLKASTELTSVWFEFMSSMAKNMAVPGSNESANGEEERQPRARPGSRSVQFDPNIKSPKLFARLRHEFHPGRETTDLATHGLRSLKQEGASPILVSFEPDADAGRVTVNIEVADDQKPDLYTGQLLDKQTGETVGHLSLRLS